VTEELLTNRKRIDTSLTLVEGIEMRSAADGSRLPAKLTADGNKESEVESKKKCWIELQYQI